MSKPILEINGLTIAGRGAKSQKLILSDISLTIARGEILGLIGESGAGKSTLGLAAMGYLRTGCRKTVGSVSFDGADLDRMSLRSLERLRGARIAYIAQSAAASFNPVKPLGRQVAEPLVLHKGWSWRDAQRRAAVLFEELSLPAPGEFGHRFPHQVSGGQLQRAMIAMAIACDPEFLILDEPTTALDVTTQIEVLVAVRTSLQKSGAAAIYISHDLALVAQLADRIAVLKDGAMVEAGRASQIITAPAQDYTRKLIAAETPPKLAASSRRLQSDQPVSPALAIDGLGADYSDCPGVLQDINLSVECGETVAIVGASGSGKTTLGRVISGVVPRSIGSISLYGEMMAADVRKRSLEQLRRVQFVYQTPDTALNPRQRVRTILGRVEARYFRSTLAERARRVTQLLEMVGLPASLSERRPSELSGGQKQRIGIARALAARPDVIVCDEITASLDPLIAEEILALLRRLQRSTGVALVFITHDIDTVLRIADRVAVMRAGRISVQGTAASVFMPPENQDAALLLESVPEMRIGWLGDLLAARESRTNQPGVAAASTGRGYVDDASVGCKPADGWQAGDTIKKEPIE